MPGRGEPDKMLFSRGESCCSEIKKGADIMAARRQTYAYRQTYGTSSQRQAYVYGNTAPKPEVLPGRREEKRPASPKRSSRQVRKNRSRALSISPAYAAFLVVAAMCAVFICVAYLQLQAETVNRSERISALQAELADLTEQNDTAYHAVADSVNLEEVRNKAINEMGMVYASQGQVVEYESPTDDYVKQYSDIPSEGVLAKSKDVVN